MLERLGRCHGGLAAALSSGRRFLYTQRSVAGSGVSASGARIFDKVVIRSLQLSRTSGGIQASVSAGDDPSIFAIELETLARRAFIDIDISIQLQMVRDRFIDGQVESALRRHLDSLGPDTPMADIVHCCRVWKSHHDVKIEPRMSADRRPARAVCQVSVDERIPPALPETSLGGYCRRRCFRLLRRTQHHRDLLIQRLMGTVCPPEPVAQERSAVTELETMLLNWLPVGPVMEENAVSPNPSADSVEGCFSCGF